MLHRRLCEILQAFYGIILRQWIVFLLVNSVLKKLRGPRVGYAEAAALLEKHIGDARNELHCADALEAISRMRNTKIKNANGLIALIQPKKASDCDRVRALTDYLRGISGADIMI